MRTFQRATRLFFKTELIEYKDISKQNLWTKIGREGRTERQPLICRENHFFVESAFIAGQPNRFLSTRSKRESVARSTNRCEFTSLRTISAVRLVFSIECRWRRRWRWWWKRECRRSERWWSTNSDCDVKFLFWSVENEDLERESETNAWRWFPSVIDRSDSEEFLNDHYDNNKNYN